MNQELKAILTEEETLTASVEMEKLRGLQGYSAYEIYLKNLPKDEIPLSEEEWLNSISKANYYEKHEFSYTATENTKRIFIEKELKPTDILIVKINGLDLIKEMDYTISNNSIILTEFLEVGNILYYAIFRTVVATDEDYEKLRGERGFGAICWNDEEDSFDYEQLREDVDNNIDDIENINNKLKEFSLKTNTGTTLEVIMDEKTFVITFELKNESGTVLSTKSIDLPLESLVIDTSYDNNTKEIVITLQNGTTTRIPISGLLSGLVTETSFNEAIKNCITLSFFETYKKEKEKVIDSIKKDINDNTSRIKRIEFDLFDSGEAEGEAINVKDSALAEAIRIESDGGWKQETTEGYQLVDFFSPTYSVTENVTFSNDGEKIILSGNGVSAYQYRGFTFPIKKIKPNDTISFWCEESSTENINALATIQLALYFNDGTPTSYSTLYNIQSKVHKSFTFPSNTENISNVIFGIYTDNRSLTNVEANTISVTKPFLYLGTIENPPKYERYTSMEKSPSLDYNQSIEVIEAGDYEFTTMNKNLYYSDKDEYVIPSQTLGGWYFINGERGATGNNLDDKTNFKGRVQKGKRYFFTADVSIATGITAQLCYSDESIMTNNVSSYSFIAKQDDNVVLRVYVPKDTECIVKDVQLTLDNASSYEPHRESKLPFTIPEGEFFANPPGMTGDQFIAAYNEEDKHPHSYLQKNVGKIIFDGTEEWYKSSTSPEGTTRFMLYFDYIINSNERDNNVYIKSDRFQGTTWNSLYSSDTTSKCLISNYNNNTYKDGRIYIRVPNEIATTVEGLKEYFSNNPTEAYYQLSEPYLVDLGRKDMLLTFFKETNLFNDFPLPVTMKLYHYCDPKESKLQLQKDVQIANTKIATLETDLADLREKFNQLNAVLLSTVQESEVIEDDLRDE